jgi:hypothetical protein
VKVRVKARVKARGSGVAEGDARRG